MLSTMQETNPLVAIVGRCMVLELNDYCTSMFSIVVNTIRLYFITDFNFSQLAQRKSLKVTYLFAKRFTTKKKSRFVATNRDWVCVNLPTVQQ